MILSQQTKATLVKLAIEMGLDRVQLDGPNQEHSVARKGLQGKRRDELIQLISARALTNEDYMKMITPEPKPVVEQPKVEQGEILKDISTATVEFANGSKGVITFIKQEDQTWRVLKTNGRLRWLPMETEYDRPYDPENKSEREIVSQKPRELSWIKTWLIKNNATFVNSQIAVKQ